MGETRGWTLYLQGPGTARWQAAWTWHTGGPEAGRLLRLIRPHLRLKAAQADAALAVHEVWESLAHTKGGKQKRWTPEARATCEALKAELHRLTAKAPRASLVEVS